MRTQTRALIGVATLMVSVTVIFCWAASATAQDKLVIISPHWEGIQTEFSRGFKEWYENKSGRQIKLDWIDSGGSSSNFRFIESEFQRVPDGIGLDLFFGGGTDNYLKLADRGLLVPYKLPAETTAENSTRVLWNSSLRFGISMVRHSFVKFRDYAQ